MKRIIIYSLLALGLTACQPAANAEEPAATEETVINDPDVTGVQNADIEKALLTKSEKRCGWFDNPSPSNAWLTDADGQWTIATQGSYNALGDWPSVENIEDETMFVHTNGGSYGYSCACVTVKTIKSSMAIVQIEKATVRPLAKCRADQKLKEPVTE